MFAVLVFIYSTIFNAQMTSIKESEIDEVFRNALTATKQKNPSLSLDEVKKIVAANKQIERDKYGLDSPAIERIFRNALNALTFQFGQSRFFQTTEGNKDVINIVIERLPRTILLFTIEFIIVFILAIALGLKKAQRPGSKLDKRTTLVSLVLTGVPAWWFGMMMILLFGYAIKPDGKNGLFPTGGFMFNSSEASQFAFYSPILDVMYHLVLPMTTLVLLAVWGSSYMIRNVVLGTLQEDFIMSARARGIPEKKVLFGHTLRSAAPPIVTMALLGLLGSLFAGSILFEGIFNWPGMGALYWEATGKSDIPVLLCDLTLSTILFLVGLIILDLIYGFLDPRIKVGGKA
jgi:peptide/nickel transport system permease protein